MGVVNLRGNILRIFMIIFLIVSTVELAAVSTASATPVISVEPPRITAKVGETFTINVTIADVTIPNSGNGIYTWEFGMNFDPSVLNATSVMEGPFLKDAGYPTSWNMMPPQIDNYYGNISASDNLWGYPSQSQGAIGSGVLCNITFQVKDVGKTNLDFYKIILSTYISPNILPVDHMTTPGIFNNVPGFPIASFTYSPSIPKTGETVAFDGSDSKDLDGYIVSWSWDLNGDGVIDATTEKTNYTYTSAGAYNVNLTVTDNATLVDTITKIITVAKMSSTLFIIASPTSIMLGESTTINGSITPVRSGANVSIQYRLSGDETWSTLETAPTDEHGTYSHDWKPETSGTYEVKASWLGDNDTLPSESEILTVKVKTAPPIILYFLYGGAVVVVIIVVAIAIYFLRVKKLKPT